MSPPALHAMEVKMVEETMSLVYEVVDAVGNR